MELPLYGSLGNAFLEQDDVSRPPEIIKKSIRIVTFLFMQSIYKQIFNMQTFTVLLFSFRLYA
jgi:hypothetical protein